MKEEGTKSTYIFTASIERFLASDAHTSPEMTGTLYGPLCFATGRPPCKIELPRATKLLPTSGHQSAKRWGISHHQGREELVEELW